MDDWYYAMDGIQQGPVSRIVLLRLLSGGGAGGLPGEALVWHEGMPDWVAANAVAELTVPVASAATVAQPMLNYGVADSVYQPPAGSLQYAGFWIRLLAGIIDVVVRCFAYFVAGSAVEAILQGTPLGFIYQQYSGFLWIFLSWLYFASMQSSTTQASLGMMAVGLRVTDLNGRRITFGRATGRYFASLLSGCCLILCIGYLMIAWTIQAQALHDKIADTLVLYK
jgi:uncharacterized RDD family membrane protein YckC